MIQKLALLTGTSLMILSLGCQQGWEIDSSDQTLDSPEETHPSLKANYQNDFLIGTALSLDQINKSHEATDELIKHQFNAITAENIMKTEVIHPTLGKFDFDAADNFVAYGHQNNMHIIGHTLIWHSQLPIFVRTMDNADSLRQFMKIHIQTIAQHYAETVDSWDVVNEALEENGSWRQSVFYKLLGEDYLVDAFKLASAAAPRADLYYNDYNIEQPQKRAGAIRLIKKIKESGARIDGVGIQGHWQLGKVPFDEIERSIIAFADLGVKVAITELDIDVLPRNTTGANIEEQMVAGDSSLNPYTEGLPEEINTKLANDYEQLFKLFLKHKDKISRVTFWGVNDSVSWLNDWPARGRTNHPLLFDRNNQPKEAFFRVIGLKEQVN